MRIARKPMLLTPSQELPPPPLPADTARLHGHDGHYNILAFCLSSLCLAGTVLPMLADGRRGEDNGAYKGGFLQESIVLILRDVSG
jgi:hypothetical protein